MIQIPRINTIVRIWKRIDSIKGMEKYKYYEVSNLGEIRNRITGRILKPGLSGNGYLYVCLYADGKCKSFRVHRLVALAFLPNDNPDIKTIVNHKDENKTNNNVDNLEWCTIKYNVNYGTALERMVKSRKGKPNNN